MFIADREKIIEVWVKNFPDAWNGLYLAVCVLYPDASEPWKLWYSSELEKDSNLTRDALLKPFSENKANLLPTVEEYQLFLWERAKKEEKGPDRLKAAEMLGNSLGYIKKETNGFSGVNNNIMIMPAQPQSVDAWEQNAKKSQTELRCEKVIEHKTNE